MTPEEEELITEQALTECSQAQEELHLLGHIQGNAGHVLFISYPEGTVVAADTKINTVSWIWNQDNETSNCNGNSVSVARSMLGASLRSWVAEEVVTVIFDAIEDMKKARSKRTFQFSPGSSTASSALSISTTTSDYSVIGIEIETVNDANEVRNFHDTLVHLSRITEFYADEEIVNTSCDTIYNFLGNYQRGMVYRFNDDLSGEIIHEIKDEIIESSYKGMLFPASDFPLPTRARYIQNRLMYIHDVDAPDLAIVSNENDNKVDLTQCRMRAVSKPHIVYLRNKGVVGSMSLPIVVDGELWGLLTFHAYTKPFKPNLHQRIACETISSMLSVRVETAVKKAHNIRASCLGDVLMKWDQKKSVVYNLFELGKEILEVIDADVLVVSVEAPIESEEYCIEAGDKSLVPKAAFWEKLAIHPNRTLFSTSTRARITQMGLTEEDCPASGFVYFSHGRTQIMVGRSLRSKDVSRDRNPDEPKLRSPGYLNPCSSFDPLMQKAKQQARAWSPSDLKTIDVLSNHVCDYSRSWTMELLKNSVEETNQKYAKAMDLARDNYQFFAHMSHELRTPFHGVMACLNVVNDSINDMTTIEISDLINTALLSGSHMINLLNDILNISKNKHLAHTIIVDNVIYQTLCFESVDCLKSLAENQHIKFKCEILPNEEKIVIATDRTKVIQIVSNILNNAIKFAGNGSITTRFLLLDTPQEAVEAWAADAAKHAGTVFSIQESQMFTSVKDVKKRTAGMPKNKSENWMFVSVADSGCGMRPDELASMFEPYTQASNDSNRTFQGTGLGLFICVSLCLRLDGFIACSSTFDVGTNFCIGIPVEIPTESAATLTGNDELISDNTASSSPIRIHGPVLVVDDNVVNVKILHRALTLELTKSGLPIEVITGDGGGVAIQSYKERRPSLIIIDYHMPEIDGMAATKAIREYEKAESLPPAYIITYTADATDDAAQVLLDNGSDEIMPKPPPKGFIKILVGRFDMKA